MWRAGHAACFAVIPGFTFRRTSITHSTIAASVPAFINSSHSVVFRTSVLVDWLAVFGVVLDDIPRLQATLPSRYTTLIDENIYDDHSWILSFQSAAPGLAPGSIRPSAGMAAYRSSTAS